MNKEEIIENLKGYYANTENIDKVINYVEELQQENKQLKDNWNKLKQDLEYELNTSYKNSSRFYYISIIKGKMQELEKENK